MKLTIAHFIEVATITRNWLGNSEEVSSKTWLNVYKLLSLGVFLKVDKFFLQQSGRLQEKGEENLISTPYLFASPKLSAYLTSTEICFGLVSSFFGMTSFRIPSRYEALIFS